MNNQEIFAMIQNHYTKATYKHPKFCNSMTHHTAQWHGHKAQVCREIIQVHPRAIHILNGEIHEIFEAYKNGEKEHAIDECFDAIAVLIRMVEFIKDEK